MFTVDERERLRDAMIAHAQAFPDIVGAALVGSAARGREDRWSDIDLVLQLAPDGDEPSVVAAWTAWMRGQADVADTLDVHARDARYRVFLLASSLQVDVSFWPYDAFRATEDGFALVFGAANAATRPAPADVDAMIGMGWLYALHARSAVARGRVWQATIMLDHLRDQTIALACLSEGLDPWHGRDADRLPIALRTALVAARAGTVTVDALSASLAALTRTYADEVARHDLARAERLEAPLAVMAERMPDR